MHSYITHALRLCLSVSLLAVTACTSGGGDDSDDPGSGGDGGSGDGRNFTSDCGAVSGGSVVNPVSTDDMIFASGAEVVGANLLVLPLANGDALVKLHAIGAGAAGRQATTMRRLEQIIGTGGVYYLPVEGCQVQTPGGGIATTGQVFTASGTNVGEALIETGLVADIDSTGSCNERLIAGCYQELRDASVPDSAGEITDFLWKPESEGGYNFGLLSILVNPVGARVLVNGEELWDSGPSNGRGTTARSLSKSGCAYGNNVKVEVLEGLTGIPYSFPDGKLFYTVPNGCQRTEFKL